MAKRALDEGWSNWLKHNLARNCNPEELLGLLLKAEFAVESIKQVMGDKFPVHSDLLVGTEMGKKEIDYGALSRVRLTCPGSALKVRKLVTDRLQLYVLDEFLNRAECDALIEVIGRHLRPSAITIESPDKQFRTSQTCDLGLLHLPIIRALDEKIARALGIRLPYSEGIQAQRYDVGQQFKQHTDFFEPGTDEYQKFGGARGNRTWTFMVYLNTVRKGGGTRFFAVDATLRPVQGRAVIWNNLYPDGTVNRDTLHAGLPVEEGFKVILTKWFREKGGGRMFYEG